jgi:hypothetical protein
VASFRIFVEGPRGVSGRAVLIPANINISEKRVVLSLGLGKEEPNFTEFSKVIADIDESLKAANIPHEVMRINSQLNNLPDAIDIQFR